MSKSTNVPESLSDLFLVPPSLPVVHSSHDSGSASKRSPLQTLIQQMHTELISQHLTLHLPQEQTPRIILETLQMRLVATTIIIFWSYRLLSLGSRKTLASCSQAKLLVQYFLSGALWKRYHASLASVHPPNFLAPPPLRLAGVSVVVWSPTLQPYPYWAPNTCIDSPEYTCIRVQLDSAAWVTGSSFVESVFRQ